MPYKRGAPAGNTNRLKHGRHTTAAITQRKLVRATIRAAQRVLVEAEIALRFAERVPVRDTPDQERQ
jgi:hypothetical protein